uniref:histone acetyltransferase n=1 Tax=Attheya septentrionalis TaxID=420275 RepID=A0A7S2UHG6_9STRA|mmetsp:Transcript_23383/g.42197  ORF Transcript_23383/g.42197 Transcript_23383/m.42197 type:complete len:158 (+) Transcript_23383:157-630(+)
MSSPINLTSKFDACMETDDPPAMVSLSSHEISGVSYSSYEDDHGYVKNPEGPLFGGNEDPFLRHEIDTIRRQRRIGLLLHASQCPCKDDGDKCPEVPHCEALRRLWLHMQTCKNQNHCSVPTCKASKSAMKHFRKCKQANTPCPMCAPLVIKLRGSC